MVIFHSYVNVYQRVRNKPKHLLQSPQFARSPTESILVPSLVQSQASSLIILGVQLGLVNGWCTTIVVGVISQLMEVITIVMPIYIPHVLHTYIDYIPLIVHKFHEYLHLNSQQITISMNKNLTPCARYAVPAVPVPPSRRSWVRQQQHHHRPLALQRSQPGSAGERSVASSPPVKNRQKSLGVLISMDWFKGKSTGNHGFWKIKYRGFL